jgi:hypothetical protein
MHQIPCPDGYLLDAGSPLAAGHHALNQYLVRVEEAGWQTALKEINTTRNKDLKLVTWKALLERMRWLGEICDVDFKPKSNGQRVIRAAAEVSGKFDPSNAKNSEALLPD